MTKLMSHPRPNRSPENQTTTNNIKRHPYSSPCLVILDDARDSTEGKASYYPWELNEASGTGS